MLMVKNVLFYSIKTCLIVSKHKSNAKQKKKKTDFQIFLQKNAKKFTFLLEKTDFGNFRENIGIVII